MAQNVGVDVNVFLRNEGGATAGMTGSRATSRGYSEDLRHGQSYQNVQLEKEFAQEALRQGTVSNKRSFRLAGTPNLNKEAYTILDTETIGDMNGFQQITQIAMQNYNAGHQAEQQLLNMIIKLNDKSQNFLKEAINTARQKKALTDSQRYALAAMTGYSEVTKGGQTQVKVTAPQLSKNFDYGDAEFLKKVEQGMAIASGKTKTSYSNLFSEKEAIKRAVSYAGNRVVVGSNSDTYDIPLIRKMIETFYPKQTSAFSRTSDILKVAKSAPKGVLSKGFYDLRSLAQAVGMTGKEIDDALKGAQHTGEADIRLTAEINKRQAQILESLKITPFKDKTLTKGQRFTANKGVQRSNTKSFKFARNAKTGELAIDEGDFGHNLFKEGVTYSFSGRMPGANGKGNYNIFKNLETGEDTYVYTESDAELNRLLTANFIDRGKRPRNSKKNSPMTKAAQAQLVKSEEELLEHAALEFFRPASFSNRGDRVAQLTQGKVAGSSVRTLSKKLGENLKKIEEEVEKQLGPEVENDYGDRNYKKSIVMSQLGALLTHLDKRDYINRKIGGIGLSKSIEGQIKNTQNFLKDMGLEEAAIAQVMEPILGLRGEYTDTDVKGFKGKVSAVLREELKNANIAIAGDRGKGAHRIATMSKSNIISLVGKAVRTMQSTYVPSDKLVEEFTATLPDQLRMAFTGETAKNRGLQLGAKKESVGNTSVKQSVEEMVKVLRSSDIATALKVSDNGRGITMGMYDATKESQVRGRGGIDWESGAMAKFDIDLGADGTVMIGGQRVADFITMTMGEDGKPSLQTLTETIADRVKNVIFSKKGNAIREKILNGDIEAAQKLLAFHMREAAENAAPTGNYGNEDVDKEIRSIFEVNDLNPVRQLTQRSVVAAKPFINSLLRKAYGADEVEAMSGIELSQKTKAIHQAMGAFAKGRSLEDVKKMPGMEAISDKILSNRQHYDSLMAASKMIPLGYEGLKEEGVLPALFSGLDANDFGTVATRLFLEGDRAINQGYNFVDEFQAYRALGKDMTAEKKEALAKIQRKQKLANKLGLQRSTFNTLKGQELGYRANRGVNSFMGNVGYTTNADYRAAVRSLLEDRGVQGKELEEALAGLRDIREDASIVSEDYAKFLGMHGDSRSGKYVDKLVGQLGTRTEAATEGTLKKYGIKFSDVARRLGFSENTQMFKELKTEGLTIKNAPEYLQGLFGRLLSEAKAKDRGTQAHKNENKFWSLVKNQFGDTLGALFSESKGEVVEGNEEAFQALMKDPAKFMQLFDFGTKGIWGRFREAAGLTDVSLSEGSEVFNVMRKQGETYGIGGTGGLTPSHTSVGKRGREDMARAIGGAILQAADRGANNQTIEDLRALQAFYEENWSTNKDNPLLARGEYGAADASQEAAIEKTLDSLNRHVLTGNNNKNVLRIRTGQFNRTQEFSETNPTGNEISLDSILSALGDYERLSEEEFARGLYGQLMTKRAEFAAARGIKDLSQIEVGVDLSKGALGGEDGIKLEGSDLALKYLPIALGNPLSADGNVVLPSSEAALYKMLSALGKTTEEGTNQAYGKIKDYYNELENERSAKTGAIYEARNKKILTNAGTFRNIGRNQISETEDDFQGARMNLGDLMKMFTVNAKEASKLSEAEQASLYEESAKTMFAHLREWGTDTKGIKWKDFSSAVKTGNLQDIKDLYRTTANLFKQGLMDGKTISGTAIRQPLISGSLGHTLIRADKNMAKGAIALSSGNELALNADRDGDTISMQGMGVGKSKTLKEALSILRGARTKATQDQEFYKLLQMAENLDKYDQPNDPSKNTNSRIASEKIRAKKQKKLDKTNKEISVLESKIGDNAPTEEQREDIKKAIDALTEGAPSSKESRFAEYIKGAAGHYKADKGIPQLVEKKFSDLREAMLRAGYSEEQYNTMRNNIASLRKEAINPQALEEQLFEENRMDIQAQIDKKREEAAGYRKDVDKRSSPNYARQEKKRFNPFAEEGVLSEEQYLKGLGLSETTIGSLTKWQKHNVGIFSNMSEAFRSRLMMKGADELNLGSGEVDRATQEKVASGMLLRSLFEQMEQEIISTKKLGRNITNLNKEEQEKKINTLQEDTDVLRRLVQGTYTENGKQLNAAQTISKMSAIMSGMGLLDNNRVFNTAVSRIQRTFGKDFVEDFLGKGSVIRERGANETEEEWQAYLASRKTNIKDLAMSGRLAQEAGKIFGDESFGRIVGLGRIGMPRLTSNVLDKAVKNDEGYYVRQGSMQDISELTEEAAEGEKNKIAVSQELATVLGREKQAIAGTNEELKDHIEFLDAEQAANYEKEHRYNVWGSSNEAGSENVRAVDYQYSSTGWASRLAYANPYDNEDYKEFQRIKSRLGEGETIDARLMGMSEGDFARFQERQYNTTFGTLEHEYVDATAKANSLLQKNGIEAIDNIATLFENGEVKSVITDGMEETAKNDLVAALKELYLKVNEKVETLTGDLKTLIPELDSTGMKNEAIKASITAQELYQQMGIRAGWTNPEAFIPAFSEHSFAMKVGGQVVPGTFDQTFINEETGELIGVDNKNKSGGKLSLDNIFQMMLQREGHLALAERAKKIAGEQGWRQEVEGQSTWVGAKSYEDLTDEQKAQVAAMHFGGFKTPEETFEAIKKYSSVNSVDMEAILNGPQGMQGVKLKNFLNLDQLKELMLMRAAGTLDASDPRLKASNYISTSGNVFAGDYVFAEEEGKYADKIREANSLLKERLQLLSQLNEANALQDKGKAATIQTALDANEDLIKRRTGIKTEEDFNAMYEEYAQSDEAAYTVAKEGIGGQGKLAREFVASYEEAEKAKIDMIRAEGQMKNRYIGDAERELAREKYEATANVYNAKAAQYEQVRENVNTMVEQGLLDPRVREQAIKDIGVLSQKYEALGKQAQMETFQQKSFFKQLGLGFKQSLRNLMDYQLAYQIIGKVKQGFQQTIQTAKQLDAAITNMQIVTNGSKDSARELMRTFYDLADSMGRTAEEASKVATEWMRAGYRGAELNSLIESTLALSTLGMIDSAQATKYLTSQIKGWKLSTEDMMSVVDKLTTLDANAAVSAGDLAEAMSRANVSAQMGGSDWDTYASYITTVADVTQKSVSSIGESFKTLYARYGNVKLGKWNPTEEDKSGENFNAADYENLNDIETALKKAGIAYRSGTKDIRDFDEVMSEIGSKWANMDQVTQNAIASAMGGTRQRENINALFSNWDKVQHYIKLTENASGTASQKMEAYNDSVAASAQRVTNAFQEWVLEGSVVGGTIKNINKLLEGLMKHLNLLMVAGAGIATAFAGPSLFGFLGKQGAKKEFNTLAGGSHLFSNFKGRWDTQMEAQHREIDRYTKTLGKGAPLTSEEIINKSATGVASALDNLTNYINRATGATEAQADATNADTNAQRQHTQSTEADTGAQETERQARIRGAAAFMGGGANRGGYNILPLGATPTGAVKARLGYFGEKGFFANRSWGIKGTNWYDEQIKQARKSIEEIRSHDFHPASAAAADADKRAMEIETKIHSLEEERAKKVAPLTDNQRAIAGGLSMVGNTSGMLGGMAIGRAIGKAAGDEATGTLLGTFGGMGVTQLGNIIGTTLGGTLGGPIGMAVGGLLTGIVGLIVNGIEKHKQEIKDHIKELTQDIEKNEATLADIESSAFKKRYEELSRGVDSLGRNISLSTEDYAEYREMLNKLIEVNPATVKAYDEEGNALVERNNLLEKSIDLLKEENRQKKKDLYSGEEWEQRQQDLYDEIYKDSAENGYEVRRLHGIGRASVNGQGIITLNGKTASGRIEEITSAPPNSEVTAVDFWGHKTIYYKGADGRFYRGKNGAQIAQKNKVAAQNSFRKTMADRATVLEGFDDLSKEQQEIVTRLTGSMFLHGNSKADMQAEFAQYEDWLQEMINNFAEGVQVEGITIPIHVSLDVNGETIKKDVTLGNLQEIDDTMSIEFSNKSREEIAQAYLAKSQEKTKEEVINFLTSNNLVPVDENGNALIELEGDEKNGWKVKKDSTATKFESQETYQAEKKLRDAGVSSDQIVQMRQGLNKSQFLWTTEHAEVTSNMSLKEIKEAYEKYNPDSDSLSHKYDIERTKRTKEGIEEIGKLVKQYREDGYVKAESIEKLKEVNESFGLSTKDLEDTLMDENGALSLTRENVSAYVGKLLEADIANGNLTASSIKQKNAELERLQVFGYEKEALKAAAQQLYEIDKDGKVVIKTNLTTVEQELYDAASAAGVLEGAMDKLQQAVQTLVSLTKENSNFMQEFFGKMTVKGFSGTEGLRKVFATFGLEGFGTEDEVDTDLALGVRESWKKGGYKINFGPMKEAYEKLFGEVSDEFFETLLIQVNAAAFKGKYNFLKLDEPDIQASGLDTMTAEEEADKRRDIARKEEDLDKKRKENRLELFKDEIEAIDLLVKSNEALNSVYEAQASLLSSKDFSGRLGLMAQQNQITQENIDYYLEQWDKIMEYEPDTPEGAQWKADTLDSINNSLIEAKKNMASARKEAEQLRFEMIKTATDNELDYLDRELAIIQRRINNLTSEDTWIDFDSIFGSVLLPSLNEVNTSSDYGLDLSKEIQNIQKIKDLKIDAAKKVAREEEKLRKREIEDLERDLRKLREDLYGKGNSGGSNTPPEENTDSSNDGTDNSSKTPSSSNTPYSSQGSYNIIPKFKIPTKEEIDNYAAEIQKGIDSVNEKLTDKISILLPVKKSDETTAGMSIEGLVDSSVDRIISKLESPTLQSSMAKSVEGALRPTKDAVDTLSTSISDSLSSAFYNQTVLDSIDNLKKKLETLVGKSGHDQGPLAKIKIYLEEINKLQNIRFDVDNWNNQLTSLADDLKLIKDKLQIPNTPKTSQPGLGSGPSFYSTGRKGGTNGDTSPNQVPRGAVVVLKWTEDATKRKGYSNNYGHIGFSDGRGNLVSFIGGGGGVSWRLEDLAKGGVYNDYVPGYSWGWVNGQPLSPEQADAIFTKTGSNYGLKGGACLDWVEKVYANAFNTSEPWGGRWATQAIENWGMPSYYSGTLDSSQKAKSKMLIGETYENEIIGYKDGHSEVVNKPTVRDKSDVDYVIGVEDTKKINYATGTPTSNPKYLEWIGTASKAFGIPAEYILSILDQETSGGLDPSTHRGHWAKKKDGSIWYDVGYISGLMQVSDGAIRDLQGNENLSNILEANNVWFPDINGEQRGTSGNYEEVDYASIMGGTAYLKYLLDKNGGDMNAATADYYGASGFYNNEVMARANSEAFQQAASSLSSIEKTASNIEDSVSDEPTAMQKLLKELDLNYVNEEGGITSLDRKYDKETMQRLIKGTEGNSSSTSGEDLMRQFSLQASLYSQGIFKLQHDIENLVDSAFKEEEVDVLYEIYDYVKSLQEKRNEFEDALNRAITSYGEEIVSMLDKKSGFIAAAINDSNFAIERMSNAITQQALPFGKTSLLQLQAQEYSGQAVSQQQAIDKASEMRKAEVDKLGETLSKLDLTYEDGTKVTLNNILDMVDKSGKINSTSLAKLKEITNNLIDLNPDNSQILTTIQELYGGLKGYSSLIEKQVEAINAREQAINEAVSTIKELYSTIEEINTTIKDWNVNRLIGIADYELAMMNAVTQYQDTNLGKLTSTTIEEDILGDKYAALVRGLEEDNEVIQRARNELTDVWQMENIGRFIDNTTGIIDQDALNKYFAETGANAQSQASIKSIFDILSKSYTSYAEGQKSILSTQQEIISKRQQELNIAAELMNVEIKQDEVRLSIVQGFNDWTNKFTSYRNDVKKELRSAKQMSQYLDANTRKLVFNEADYTFLLKTVDKLEAQMTSEYNNYKKAIEALTEDTLWKEQYITEEYKERMELIQKEYDISRAKVDLEKKQLKLNNVLAEKNTRMLINGEWRYVANPNDVNQSQQEYDDARAAKEAAEKEVKDAKEELELSNSLRDKRMAQQDLKERATRNEDLGKEFSKAITSNLGNQSTWNHFQRNIDRSTSSVEDISSYFKRHGAYENEFGADEKVRGADITATSIRTNEGLTKTTELSGIVEEMRRTDKDDKAAWNDLIERYKYAYEMISRGSLKDQFGGDMSKVRAYLESQGFYEWKDDFTDNFQEELNKLENTIKEKTLKGEDASEERRRYSEVFDKRIDKINAYEMAGLFEKGFAEEAKKNNFLSTFSSVDSFVKDFLPNFSGKNISVRKLMETDWRGQMEGLDPNSEEYQNLVVLRMLKQALLGVSKEEIMEDNGIDENVYNWRLGGIVGSEEFINLKEAVDRFITGGEFIDNVLITAEEGELPQKLEAICEASGKLVEDFPLINEYLKAFKDNTLSSNEALKFFPNAVLEATNALNSIANANPSSSSGSIPSFADGTEFFGGGLLNHSELGSELLIPSSGYIAAMQYGSTVVPAQQAKNIMKWGTIDPTTFKTPEISSNLIDNSLSQKINIENIQLTEVKKFDDFLPAMNSFLKRTVPVTKER